MPYSARKTRRRWLPDRATLLAISSTENDCARLSSSHATSFRNRICVFLADDDGTGLLATCSCANARQSKLHCIAWVNWLDGCSLSRSERSRSLSIRLLPAVSRNSKPRFLPKNFSKTVCDDSGKNQYALTFMDANRITGVNLNGYLASVNE